MPMPRTSVEVTSQIAPDSGDDLVRALALDRDLERHLAGQAVCRAAVA